jgi:nitrate reductase NapE component
MAIGCGSGNNHNTTNNIDNCTDNNYDMDDTVSSFSQSYRSQKQSSDTAVSIWIDDTATIIPNDENLGRQRRSEAELPPAIDEDEEGKKKSPPSPSPFPSPKEEAPPKNKATTKQQASHSNKRSPRTTRRLVILAIVCFAVMIVAVAVVGAFVGIQRKNKTNKNDSLESNNNDDNNSGGDYNKNYNTTYSDAPTASPSSTSSARFTEGPSSDVNCTSTIKTVESQLVLRLHVKAEITQQAVDYISNVFQKTYITLLLQNDYNDCDNNDLSYYCPHMVDSISLLGHELLSTDTNNDTATTTTTTRIDNIHSNGNSNKRCSSTLEMIFGLQGTHYDEDCVFDEEDEDESTSSTTTTTTTTYNDDNNRERQRRYLRHQNNPDNPNQVERIDDGESTTGRYQQHGRLVQEEGNDDDDDDVEMMMKMTGPTGEEIWDAMEPFVTVLPSVCGIESVNNTIV